MLDPQICNLEIVSLDPFVGGWIDVAKALITRQPKLKELQIGWMESLSNIALPIKRLYFCHSGEEPEYSFISSEFLRKCKDTLEELEIGRDPTKEILSVVMKDLQRLKALSVELFINDKLKRNDDDGVEDDLLTFTPNKSIETLLLSGGQDGFILLSELLDKLPNVKRFSCGLTLTHDQWRLISINMTKLEEIHFCQFGEKHLTHVSGLTFPSVTIISLGHSELFINLNFQLRVAFPNVETLKIFEMGLNVHDNLVECHKLLKIIGDYWPLLKQLEIGKGFRVNIDNLLDFFTICRMLKSFKLYDESVIVFNSRKFDKNIRENLKNLQKKGLCFVEWPKLDYRRGMLSFTEPLYD